MPDPYRVNYTRLAVNQLQDIYDYIAQDSPQNAASIIGRIVDMIDRLETLPHRYPIVEHTFLTGEEIRSMPVRPYLVRYHINDSRQTVTIVSVRHGARKSNP